MYLWNRSRYRQRKMDLIDSVHFCIEQKKKLVRFGPVAIKFCQPICTHPKSTMRTILDNFRLWSQISLEQIKRSTIGNKLDRLSPLLH